MAKSFDRVFQLRELAIGRFLEECGRFRAERRIGQIRHAELQLCLEVGLGAAAAQEKGIFVDRKVDPDILVGDRAIELLERVLLESAIDKRKLGQLQETGFIGGHLEETASKIDRDIDGVFDEVGSLDV